MDKQNELNDIILNKSAKDNSNKKVLLSIATFAILLIIVVVVMNQMGGPQTSTLPHPPKKRAVVVEEVAEEPDYVDTSVPIIEPTIEHTNELVDKEVIEEVSAIPTDPITEPTYIEKVKEVPKTKTVPAKKVHKEKIKKPTAGKYNAKTKKVDVPKVTKPAVAVNGKYYIQVGSFAKYKPSKKFLHKIEKRGYTYTYHSVTRNGKKLKKVLVGPFKTQASAREALPIIKRHVESGAFLTKI